MWCCLMCATRSSAGPGTSTAARTCRATAASAAVLVRGGGDTPGRSAGGVAVPLAALMHTDLHAHEKYLDACCR